jgi:hypothetical protein
MLTWIPMSASVINSLLALRITAWWLMPSGACAVIFMTSTALKIVKITFFMIVGFK